MLETDRPWYGRMRDAWLARIREKFDAMALGYTLILPLVHLQRPLHQIALDAKPAMMALAGLVPCADAGISTTSRWPSPRSR